MANNGGIYVPVTVGLEEGVRAALAILKPEIRSLQGAMDKQPLLMRVKYDGSLKSVANILKATNIDADKLAITMKAVNAQLSAYKKKPLTPKNAAEIKKLEAALGALQVKLNEVKGVSLNKVVAEIEKLAIKEDKAAEKAERMSASLKRASVSARQLGPSMRTVTDYSAALAHSANQAATAFGMQSTYLSRMVGRMLVYAGIFRGISMLKSIRDTTAEFELQRVALGGILQDADKAKELFGQIKAAAVKSPFEIKDLVSYTKQLSAYRIEYDKLFDTTMMLADVSAGLGVDMSRLILAFGQVRAASVLRGQELRQFTEAGVPLVELLADKFTQLNNRLVSTAEVFELISKRAVPFKMVEEIFEDMTSAGGIFYEMQAKQADTLKGKFLNLKDAVSIVYDEMGRSRIVNEALNSYINLMQDLAKNWRTALSVIKSVSTGLLGYAAVTKILIPLYNLNSKGIWNTIKANKAKAILDQKMIGLTDLSTKSAEAQIAILKKKTAADYAAYIQSKKMSEAELILYARRNINNAEVKKGILLTGRMSKEQLKQLATTKRLSVEWTYFTGKLGVFVKGVGRAILTTLRSIGLAMLKILPIAAISALVSVIQDQKQAAEDTQAALSDVNKRYQEREVSIQRLIAAYEQLKATVEEVGEAEREEAMLGVRSEQIRIIQQIQKEMEKFGLRDIFNIDFASYDYDQLNQIIEGWTNRLTEAGQASKEFATEIETAANRAEGKLLGIRTKGTNLTTDIDQVKRAYAKLFGGKEFRTYVDNMRVFVDTIKNENKELYAELSEILGQDAQDAFARRKRNESEYESNMRLLESYKLVYSTMTNVKKDLSMPVKYGVSSLSSDIFDRELQDVYDEMKSAYDRIADQDPLQIRMVIDRVFADKEWDDWIKEAYIKLLNATREASKQIPYYTNLEKGSEVLSGFRAILKEDFSGFMSNEDIEKIATIDGLVEAIDKKIKSAKDKVENVAKLSNDISSLDIEKQTAKIDALQKEISEELEKGLEADQNIIKSKREQILAIEAKNRATEKEIEEAKAAAKAEYELAQAVKSRLAAEGLSSVAKQIRESYTDILADEFSQITDPDYSVKFLFSDKELSEIKNVGDLYDKWKSKLQSVNQEMKKLANVGLSEEAIAKRTAEIEAERAAVAPRLAELEKQIVEAGLEDEVAKYNALKLELAKATTLEEQVAAQQKLDELLNDGKYAQAAKLSVEKQILEARINATNNEEIAAEKSRDYIDHLTVIRQLLQGVGQDWGFVSSQSEDALEPLMSSIAKTLKTRFPQLMVDATKALTDGDYSTEFLISDEELAKIKNISELYDWWEKTTKALEERLKELQAVQVSPAEVERARQATAAQTEEIDKQIAEIDQQLNPLYEDQVKTLEKLYRQQKHSSEGTEKRKKIDKQISEILNDQNYLTQKGLVAQKEQLELKKQDAETLQAAKDSVEEQIRLIKEEYGPALAAIAELFNLALIKKLRSGGAGEDPWILLYKNRMKFMQDFRKDMEKLNSFMTESEALMEERANMLGRGRSVKIDVSSLTGSREELIKWYEDTIKEVVDKIKQLGGKGEFEGLGIQDILAKDFSGRKIQKYQELLQELWKGLTDFRVEKLQDDFEKKLSILADKISQSQTAKNFFNDILSQTGDRQLAADMTISVYGEVGEDLKKNMIEQVRDAFAGVDVTSAINMDTLAINYRQLADIYSKNQDKILEKNRQTAKQLVDNGLKASADQIKAWYQEVEKAKTYATQRVELARKTAERIKEIEESNIPKTEKQELIKAYTAKEDKEAQRLAYEAFKNSPMYVQLFENLDNASTQMLTNMRERLSDIKSEWKNLEPEQVKELTRRMQELNNQIAQRNPFKVIGDSIKEAKNLGGLRAYYDAMDDAEQAEMRRERSAEALELALGRLTAAQKIYDATVEKYGANSSEAIAAEKNLKNAQATVYKIKEQADATKDAADKAEELLGKWNAIFESISKAIGGLDKFIGKFQSLSDSTTNLLSSIGVDEATVGHISDEINALVNTMASASQVAGGVLKVISGGDIVGGVVDIITGLIDTVSSVWDMFTGGTIYKANREIERQQKLLDNLEDSYNRLEKAQAKAIGTEYIQNYSQQLSNLEAQQAAYAAQAEAEKSKGKKSDEEKVAEYERAALDAQDQMIEVKDAFFEKMAGTTLTSAAQEFAEAWIEAYKEFGSVTGAMSDKFNEMIQNMIVQSLAAKVMESILSPLFAQIDELAKDGELSAEDIALISKQVPGYIELINSGMQNMVNELGAAGLNLRSTGQGLTGISKDIANASEESILGLASGINTQNFYISQIHANVAQILLLMQGNGAQIAQQATAGTALQVDNPYITQYLPSIDQHTANIESYCAQTLDALNKVIKPSGSKGSHWVVTS